MKKWIFTFATMLLGLKAFAAMHPHDQLAREIAKILSSTEVKQEFPEGYKSIEKTQDGYIVRSNDGAKEMKIEVIYLPQKNIGPKQFKLRFREILDTPPNLMG